jgi:hypothetical protein
MFDVALQSLYTQTHTQKMFKDTQYITNGNLHKHDCLSNLAQIAMKGTVHAQALIAVSTAPTQLAHYV